MPQHGIVIADSSVLINFLAVDRMDLIAAHPHTFLVTNHVSREIKWEVHEDRYHRYQEALKAGVLEEIEVNDAVEVEMFGQLSGKRLGPGECSAIAVAINRGYELAIDDAKAIRAAKEINPKLIVLKTQDLMLDCIRRELIDIAEADSIKDDWNNNHRFALKIGTFASLL